ncbi:MAG TPA: hypothetical protein VNE39_06570 [Planctomycetota bacterium]|nr:hypothetical protein [Planctomycetota bacterium]
MSVDCGKTLQRPPILWGHVNVSRRAPPPVELCARVEKEFGRPEVTRCWLMLDQMWDYRTDTYRFDYEINKNYYAGDPNKKRYGVVGHTTGLRYYDYVDSVSAHSKAVLMNIRRYEQEVLTGMLTFEKWKEVFKAAVRHYKERCPNLLYIEVLNEPTAGNQSNLGKLENYYGFYRRAYEAIVELNAEMKPKLPLRVGGNAGFRTKEALRLVNDFARDPSPAKKLDFLSFHHYWVAAPAEIAGWEDEIDGALKKAALPADLPIFVTEIGYALKWQDDPKKNLWQAAGMTAFQFQARYARDLRLFPWVQYHSQPQIAMVQFDTRLRMTPYGAAVKMLRMHREREVVAVSSGLGQKGNGLGALATMDDAGLTVHLWNLQPDGGTAVRAEVAVAHLPETLRTGALVVRRYLIDSTHSNCFAAPDAAGGLEMVEERRSNGSADLRLSAELEPMALCLWQIEKARAEQQ